MSKPILTMSAYNFYGDNFGDYLRKRGIAAEHFVFLPTLFRSKKNFSSKSGIVFSEVYALIKLLFHFNVIRNRKLYCSSCHYSMMFVYRIFNKLIIGSHGHLYLHNFYIHGLGQKKIIKKILKFLLNNKHITIICQSPNEMTYFRNLSNKVQLTFVPFSSDFFPKQYERIDSKNNQNYFFSGGYTNRDYDLICELAKNHPESQFVIVASHLNKIIKVGGGKCDCKI
jgi:hypothetical protein